MMFIKKSIFAPVIGDTTFIMCYISTHNWVYFLTFYPIPIVRLFTHVPVSRCFNFRGFIIKYIVISGRQLFSPRVFPTILACLVLFFCTNFIINLHGSRKSLYWYFYWDRINFGRPGIYDTQDTESSYPTPGISFHLFQFTFVSFKSVLKLFFLPLIKSAHSSPSIISFFVTSCYFLKPS